MTPQQSLLRHRGRETCPSSNRGWTILPKASRRFTGSSSNNRNRPHAPAQPRKPTASTPVSLGQKEEPEPVEVPSIGWMWQTGSSNSSGSDGGAGPSRPMPTARSTVVNLYEDRIKAKKSLGQNFLMDDGVLRDIVAAAGVAPGDLVLEVGPGTGNLTKHLLAMGAAVTAVEKDDTLYGRLREEYQAEVEQRQLALVHGDVLQVRLKEIIRGMMQQERQPTQQEESSSGSGEGEGGSVGSSSGSSDGTSTPPSSPPRRKVKVVANLPYNITKDLLLILLPMGDLVSDLHIMIQHEAAVRLTERNPGGPDWRSVNIRTLYYCKPKYRFRIAREKYDPVPGVDGALVTFSLLPPAARPHVPSERGFHVLVGKAFSERRKKMRNSMQPLYKPEQVQAALAACDLNVDARAQDLTLQQFVQLAWQLHRTQPGKEPAGEPLPEGVTLGG